MDAVWSSAEMVDIIDARPVGQLPEGVGGVSADPHSLTPGCAFFALKTGSFDGHDHMTAAAKAGAGLAVVDEDRLVALGHTRLPLLVVRDVAAALAKLAAAARARSHVKMIAVTGSAGKTTTAKMLQAVLSKAGKVNPAASAPDPALQLALTLAGLPADARFCAVDIRNGENIADEAALLRPGIVVVTNTAAGAAKLEALFSPLLSAMEKDGAVLINRDDRNHKLLGELAAQCGAKEVATFGSKRGSDFLLTNCEPLQNGQQVGAELRGEPVSFRLSLRGRHMALNAISALGAAALAGAETKTGTVALGTVELEKGRGRLCRLKARSGYFTLIDESGHANPASMKAALQLLGETAPGNNGSRIAILGDMNEGGKAQHVSLEKPLLECDADTVYLAGAGMAHLAGKLGSSIPGGHFDEVKSLGEALAGKVSGGDVVLVKACSQMNFGSLVEHMLVEFPAATNKRFLNRQPV